MAVQVYTQQAQALRAPSLRPTPGAEVSLGVLAWNEERSLPRTLYSLFEQTLFHQLQQQGKQAEVIVVPNGCTDGTADVAARVLDEILSRHPYRSTISARVTVLTERGKARAWNRFVHETAANSAQVLFLMDADILFWHPETLWNMYSTLILHPGANASVDQPIKDIALQPRKTFRERLSLATSNMTQRDGPQLTGQLYCLRAEVARRIALPRDWTIEDGLIKTLICTDFLTRKSNPERVVLASEASHVFTAYRSIPEILKNQRRQMIGQTLLHVLVDKVLPAQEPAAREDFAAWLRQKEASDPDWFQRHVATHLRDARFFWRLFPHLLTFRFRRLAHLCGWRRCAHFPAALTGFVVTLLTSYLAHRSLRRGCLCYWPHGKDSSTRLSALNSTPAASRPGPEASPH